MRQEWLVDFGDNKSSRFVELAMVESVAHGAKMCQQIVRCKDCKHSGAKGCICYHFITVDTWEEPVPSNVDPDGFCAWGERRADNEQRV